MFLILLVMRPVKVVYDWCQRWLPSNRLVHLVRTRRGLRWGIPLVLLGAGYFAGWALGLVRRRIAHGAAVAGAAR